MKIEYFYISCIIITFISCSIGFKPEENETVILILAMSLCWPFMILFLFLKCCCVLAISLGNLFNSEEISKNEDTFQ